jgi:hypothetical protein
VGNQLRVPTTIALIDVTTQHWCPAGKDFAHILKHHRPNPLLTDKHKLSPMDSKDSRNAIPNLQTWTEHLQLVLPILSLLLGLKRFDELEQLVLQFEVQLVKLLVLLIRDLACLFETLVARVEFTT